MRLEIRVRKKREGSVILPLILLMRYNVDGWVKRYVIVELGTHCTCRKNA